MKIDYEKRGQEWNKKVRYAGDWNKNVEIVVRWSPFSSESDLLRQVFSILLMLKQIPYILHAFFMNIPLFASCILFLFLVTSWHEHGNN